MRGLVRTRYLAGVATLVVAAVVAITGFGWFSGSHVVTANAEPAGNSANTTTPIKHVIVLFDENVSFDHYFGTYPYATNVDGTTFCPAAGTPGLAGATETVNTELASGDLPKTILGAPVTNGACPTFSGVTPNPEAGATPPIANTTAPNPNAYQPERIPDTDDHTCDNSHSYTAEQEAEDKGKMDEFVQYTSAKCATPGVSNGNPGIGLDYYDGNTVAAMWHLAQNYGLADNSWDAGFGPSFPGYVNSFGGTTYSSTEGSALTSNIDPSWDIDSENWSMSGNNIGDLLNQKEVSWGSFEDSYYNTEATESDLNGDNQRIYTAGWDPFDFWQDTSNPSHVEPKSLSEIGGAGPANHNYDLNAFNSALANSGGAALPAVSFVRPGEPQSAHPDNSGPLDEQKFLTREINKVEQSAYWPSTAIVVEYDDSDGWYDHQSPTADIYTDEGAKSSSPSTNNIIYDSSNTSSDSAICREAFEAGVPELGGQPKRCGPSQRLPMIVISPYAKKNYVSHALITQDSTLQFIEENWGLGRMGPYTFDQQPQIDNLESFFDWNHPQQNEVLLDETCNVSGLTVVSDTCNNTTAHAVAGDGITDEGTTADAGFGAVHATPATSVPVPPTVTVEHQTVTVPLKVGGTLSTEAFLRDAGASADEGTVEADFSEVNLSKPGTYTAHVSASFAFTYQGVSSEISSMEPQTVTIDVVPTVSVANPTLTYEASAPPTAAKILADSGASIDAGTLAAPDLTGVELTTPGSYTVEITGSDAGAAATPVPVTIDVIPTPTISLAHATVRYQAGESPTPGQVLAEAGATINVGSLAAPDLSGVKFGEDGSYPVSVTGADGSFAASPAQLTIEVVGSNPYEVITSTPRLSLAKAAVAYLVGASPTPAQVLADAGATTTEGTMSVDLSPVNFGAVGVYDVRVTGIDGGREAVPVTLAVDVIAPPVVSLRSTEISTMAGSALSPAQVLAAAGATVPGGGTVSGVDLSGVDFNRAGSYPVTVGGSLHGVAATPATVAIDVIAAPTLSVGQASLTYTAGPAPSPDQVLSAAGASVSNGGSASVDLSGVDFGAAGHYSARVDGNAGGIATASATLSITVRPVITLQHPTLTTKVGAKLTSASLLKSAGAYISSGLLDPLNMAGLTGKKAGTFNLTVSGSAAVIPAESQTLTVTVKPVPKPKPKKHHKR